jgi:hypothetical protein
LAAENEEVLLDAGAALTLADIRGPITEDAENTGAEGPGPVDMRPTAEGGTEKEGSSTSMGELARKKVNGPWLYRLLSRTPMSLCV